jgi:hypothetical protein
MGAQPDGKALQAGGDLATTPSLAESFAALVRGLADLTHSYQEEWKRLDPLVQYAKERLRAVGEALPAVAARIREYQELHDRWVRDAPAVLKDAVSAKGLIVPISQMSLYDLEALFQLNLDGGSSAVVDRIEQMYDEIFSGAEFLDSLEASWTTNKHMSRRAPLLRDALIAHRYGLFGASIPTLVAQFEGLVADIAGHAGRMDGAELRKHVEDMTMGDVLGAPILLSFLNDALLAKFYHGSPVPPFSRHAVLHGADVNYGTERNSRTAILLIDQVGSLP